MGFLGRIGTERGFLLTSQSQVAPAGCNLKSFEGVVAEFARRNSLFHHNHHVAHRPRTQSSPPPAGCRSCARAQHVVWPWRIPPSAICVARSEEGQIWGQSNCSARDRFRTSVLCRIPPAEEIRWSCMISLTVMLLAMLYRRCCRHAMRISETKKNGRKYN